jgi:glycosyltransferase involved in cell wall biosynthesis
MAGYRLAQARAATCTELREALAKNIFMQRDKIHILPTCVRISDFLFQLDHPKKPFLLHVGTMPYKHPEKSMAALDLLQDARLQLLITGPSCPWVEKSLASLSTQTRPRIRLLGVVPASQLRSLMSEATAVLVPSGYHIPVLSPTVLESFAAGAAVICTSSISRDLIHPGKNCLVAESPSLVASHCNTLTLSPEVGKDLGRQALQDVGPFDAIEVAKRLKKILQEL